MGLIIRQSIKGTFVTYIGAFIGFLTTLYIIPKFVGDELYGLTRVLVEAGILFAAIFQLGTSQSVMRFFPYFKNKEKNNNGFFFYMISIISIGFLIFVPVFLLLKDPVSSYFTEKSPMFVDYLYWVIPLTFFIIYWQTFEVYSSVLLRIAIPKLIREVIIRLLVIVVYMAYALGYIGLDGFVIGFVSVYGIVMLLMFFYVSKIGPISLRHDKRFITPELKKSYFSYSSIIILGALGGTLANKIGLFMVSGMEGLALTGVYSVASYMISTVEIPSRSITAISAPLAAEALKKGDLLTANNLYKKVSINQLLIGSVIFLLIWTNIDNIYNIIPNGESYSAGKWVVLFIGIAKLIEISLGFGFHLISFSKYYRWNLYFTFLSAGTSILFNYLLIPRFGISGSAMATASSCLIFYLFQQWLVFVKIKANPYSMGTVKIFLMIAVVLTLNYFLPDIDNAFIDIIYRSAIIGVVMFLMVYFLNISNEIKHTINKIIKRQ